MNVRPQFRPSVAVTVLVALLLALRPVPAAAGTEARLHGVISDEQGQPVADAVITVTTASLSTFRQVWKTNKKGRYTGLLGDATLTYNFKVEKAGFQTISEERKLPLEGTIKYDFTLRAGSAPAAAAPAAPTGSAAAIAIYNEGAAALRAGDFATARQKLEAAIDKDSKLATAHGVLALVLVQQKENQAALAAADRALALVANEPNALQARYDAYKALGDNTNADAAARALAAAGQNSDAARRIYNEGAAASKAGDLAGAIAKLEEATRLDATLAPAWDALTGLYYGQKRWAEAAAAAEQLVKLDPSSRKGLQVRYEAYQKLGDGEKAGTALVALAAVDPSVGAGSFYNQGVEHFNQGETAEAIATFEQGLTLDPNHAQSHYSLGLCYVNTGEGAKAREHFERFLALAPDSPDAATAREMLQYVK